MKAAIETLSDADAKSICAISDRYESETVALAVVSPERYRGLRMDISARGGCDADEGMAGYFDIYDAARLVRVTIVRSSAPTHPSSPEGMTAYPDAVFPRAGEEYAEEYRQQDGGAS